jgi:hypothetical protein
MSDEADVLEITLVRKEKSVKIVDKDGQPRTYTLREMTGSTRDKWLNFMSNRMKSDENGGRSISRYDDLQSTLISFCLYDDGDKLVPKETVSGWNASALNKLFDLCQKMNGLTDDAAEEEKKG